MRGLPPGVTGQQQGVMGNNDPYTEEKSGFEGMLVIGHMLLFTSDSADTFESD